MIENLGSQKTVVRKSTHRCIASFVKLSLKLELVLKLIINVGLVHTKHRTRQHSMLVIPALLSLKKSCVKSRDNSIIQLIEAVANKLFDPSEIVQKTAKKLLIELKRVYPDDTPQIIMKINYELESEDEDELNQPVQNIIQKQQKESPAFKANDEISNIHNRKEQNERIRESNSHKRLEENYAKKYEVPESVVTSHQVEQPKVIYDKNSSVENKPDINVTKTKPFQIRETPKRDVHIKKQIEEPADQPRAQSPTMNIASNYKSHDAYQQPIPDMNRELEKPKNKFHMGKFEERDPSMLSNTQTLEMRHEPMGSGNQHIRKSMNNLNEHAMSKGTSEDHYMRNELPQQVSKQTIKPQLNSSSSQSSMSMSNKVDKASKHKLGSNGSDFQVLEKERRHETIKVEKQTTKPLIAKTSTGHEKHSIVNDHNNYKSFDTNATQSVSQSVHNDPQYTIPTEYQEETKEMPYKENNITVEVLESQPDEEQPQSENEEDEESEDEFPVALNRLVFSFLPQEVAETLNDKNDWKKRTTAIQKMENLIKKELSNPNEDFPIYITDICKKM